LLLTEKEIEVLKLRKSGLTQVEVSKKIGISQAAVSSFEKNAFKKIEDSKKILKIADQLKIKVEGGKNVN
jgi:Tfx family DNA-binding protein